MKKKIFAILFIAILGLCTVFPAFAAEADGFANEYPRITDKANLLTESEEITLEEKLDEISLRQKMDIAVATTDNLEGYSVEEYADRLYKQYNYGYSDSKDGLILLISTQSNDWYISACGYGATAFTAAGIDYIGEKITTELSGGNFSAAFEIYAQLCDDFISQARTGNPYNSDNLPREPLSLVWIPICILIGFAIAKIIVGKMKSELKTVRTQKAANNYVKSGSMSVTESSDLFLYNNITKTAKPKNNSSSGNSSSSSGASHSGGGGKF